MDSRISSASRPDVLMVESAPRPTEAPVRVTFDQVLAAGANGLVQGAELAAGRLPGSPFAAAAVRGSSSTLASSTLAGSGSSLDLLPEGPGAFSTSGSSALLAFAGVTPSAGPASTATTGPTSGTDPTSGIDASLQQSAQLNLYYLQVQQQVDAQNRSFTALSNVLKTEHDSAKAAIQNIHS
jgi:hypothetical protein